VGRNAEIDEQRRKRRDGTGHVYSPRPPTRSRFGPIEWFSFNPGMIADLIHEAAH
jgi:hypothetical protein